MARRLRVHVPRQPGPALLARARRYRNGVVPVHQAHRSAGEDRDAAERALYTADEQLLLRQVQRLVLRGWFSPRGDAAFRRRRSIDHRRLFRQRQRARGRSHVDPAASSADRPRVPLRLCDDPVGIGAPRLVGVALNSMAMLPYLSLAIWVPIVAGGLVLALHRDRDAAAARWLALVGAIASFAVTIPLYVHFTIGTPEMQFVEAVEWIPRFNVN